jgi:hypothetical protein
MSVPRLHPAAVVVLPHVGKLLRLVEPLAAVVRT